MNKKRLTAAILASACLLSGCSAVIENPPPTSTTEEVFDVDNIRAQDDFYGYVNGSYLYNMDVNPVTGSGGSFDLCSDMVLDRIQGIIADVISGDRSTYEEGSNRQIIYDAYYQILNSEVTMNSSSVVNLLATIDSINDVSSIDELLDVYSVLVNEYGVPAFYNIDIKVNPYDTTEYVPIFKFHSLGDIDRILVGGTYASEIRDNVVYTLRCLGVDEEEAHDRANNLIYMEIDIASNTNLDMVDVAQDDMFGTTYELMDIDELDNLLPNYGVDGLCRMYGISRSRLSNIGVYDIGHVAYMDSILIEENLQELKDLAIYSLMDMYGDYVPFDGPENSTPPTEEAIAMTIIRSFKDQVSELYAEYYYDETVVEDVTNMTETLIAEYVELINNSYMSAEGKAAIIDKLCAIEINIGAPEAGEVDPSNAGLIGEDALDTLIGVRRNMIMEFVNQIGSPVDRETESWSMSVYAVNACYDPRMNCITIPLGIMMSPYYDINASRGANYGGLGSVIGHEISHAFDNEGMNYDANGIYNSDWIPAEDRAIFDERNQTLIEYFNTFTVNDVYHIDGELTLGENLADIGGLQCVMSILDTSEEQEAFENYARIWASVTPIDDVIYYLEVDVHSPDRVRVNAVVSMLDEFYEIYDVSEGDPMYVAPENRITRW